MESMSLALIVAGLAALQGQAMPSADPLAPAA